MENYEPVNLQDLYNQFTPAEQVKEGTAKSTVPSNNYIFKAEKYEARKAPSDHFKYPNRTLYTLNGTIEREGSVLGRLFVDTSREVDEWRQKNGKMDGPALLWAHLVTALDAQGKSDGDVLDMSKLYPVEVYVKETFDAGETVLDPKQRWLSAHNPEERSEFFRKGYRASNRVTSIRKVR